VIYDICIVGSGAGAGPIAYELSKSGKSVVVLEKGEYLNEEDFSKDEIAISRRDLYTPNLKDEFHIIYQKDDEGKTTRYDGREYNWSFWNGSLVGGASNLMSGYFHQMMPYDFKLKSTFGEIEGANVEDWAVSYADLAPYYQKTKEIIGISGDDGNFPPLQENGATKRFDKACKKLGFKPLRVSRAILSKDAFGRNGCYYSNFCGSYPCASGAKGSSRAALLKRCNARVISNAFVYEIVTKKSVVKEVRYFDKQRRSHSIKAKIFVLALSPIETSRLLLNSKNSHFPNGVANNRGNVGKNLIFSGGGSGEGRIRFDVLNQKEQKELMTPGLFFNRSIKDFQVIKKWGRSYKGGVIDFLFEHQNIISRALREIRDKNGDLIWGEKLQKKIVEDLRRSRVLTFEVFNDWLPTDDCFVGIEKGVKDKWGVDVASIHLYSHKKDRQIGEILAKKALKILKEMGAVEISYDISPNPPPNLVAGACRFGDDPKKSVLDKNCKAWELENLYISDASFMPTGGSVPYTWTIYANSFRIADHLMKINH